MSMEVAPSPVVTNGISKDKESIESGGVPEKVEKGKVSVDKVIGDSAIDTRDDTATAITVNKDEADSKANTTAVVDKVDSNVDTAAPSTPSPKPYRSDPFNPTPSPPRRTSGRVRTATQFFVGDPAPPPPRKRKKKKSKKANDTSTPDLDNSVISAIDENGNLILVNGNGVPATSGKTLPASMIPSKSKSKSKASDDKSKKPQLKISLKRKKVPPPTFIPIETLFPLQIIWQKLVLREFVLRFDKLCRMPTRHSLNINDPNQPWTEYLYKSLVVSLLKLIANDTVPLITDVKWYLGEIERTSAESDRIWHLLEDILSNNDTVPAVDAEFEKEHGQELAIDLYHLELVRKLMNQAASTETIRLTIQHDQDELRRIQLDTIEEVKTLKASWEEQAMKLSAAEKSLPDSEKQRWNEKYVASRQNNLNKIRKTEQNCYFLHLKYNQRTAPLGIDNIGNTYWHFQQKTRDPHVWGSWIIIEPNPKYETPLGDPNEGKKKRKKKKVEVKEGEVKPEDKPEDKIGVKPEDKPEAKTGVKPEDKPEAKTEAKTEARPEDKPEEEAKPELPEDKEFKVESKPPTDTSKPPIDTKPPADTSKPPVDTSKPPNDTSEPQQNGSSSHPSGPPPPKLFYVTTKHSILELVEWIKSQWGVVNNNLIKELETYANKTDE